MTQFLIDAKKKAGLTQQQVARRLGRYQSFVAGIETGQRRLDVVELSIMRLRSGLTPAMLSNG